LQLLPHTLNASSDELSALSDVFPSENLLKEAENIIRAYPCHIGFVGHSQFPPTMNMYTNAIQLAGVSFFWEIASKMKEDIPWGVTANLLIKRIDDGVKFLPCFPKSRGHRFLPSVASRAGQSS